MTHDKKSKLFKILDCYLLQSFLHLSISGKTIVYIVIIIGDLYVIASFISKIMIQWRTKDR